MATRDRGPTGALGPPPTPARAAAARRRPARPTVGLLAASSPSSSSGRALKFLGGVAVAGAGAPGPATGPLEPAVPLAVRERPQPAPRLEHRPGRSSSRGSAAPTGTSPSTSFDAALYTWREALIGFVLGSAARARPRDRLRPFAAARAGLRPVRHRQPDDPDHRPRPDDRVRASAATSPSVVVIATYLTFFPVTIAMIRGLRSFDPRALELMRSYAASRWRRSTASCACRRRCRTCSRR